MKHNPPSQSQMDALMTLHRSGRPAKLENACKKLLGKHPDFIPLLSLLGVACQGQGKAGQAVHAFDEIIRLRPDCAEAFNNRGVALKSMGRRDQAAKNFKKAMQLDPGYAEPHYNRGDLFKASGMMTKAVAAYKTAIRLKPDYVNALIGLGDAHQALGQIEEAVHSYQTAIRIQPDSSVAYNNLGIAFMTWGQPEKALTRYDRAIRLFPDFAEAHNNRGNAFMELENLQEAVESYFRALRSKPDYAVAHNNLGNALRGLGKLQEAVESHSNAIRIHPDFSNAHHDLGNTFHEMGQFRQALENQKEAIRLQPEFAQAYNSRGNAYQALGNLNQAVADYETAIRLKPEFPTALNNLGIALKALGRFEEARHALEKAILIKPDNAKALGNLSSLKKFRPGDPLIRRMIEMLNTPSLSQQDRMLLNFAVGKASDDTGNEDAAFRHYKMGNHIKKDLLNYHIDTDKALFSRIKDAFTGKRSLAAHYDAETGPSAPCPIFILGMPRSGTTLVEQILASHSKVHGAGELNLLNNAVSETSEEFKKLSVKAAADIRRIYLEGVTELGADAPWITDKMPLNSRWIGFICLALPEAKIIHVKRKAPATCWSIFKRCFTTKGNGYACDLEDVAVYYRMYQDLMTFWHDKFPGKIYDLVYENLTESQEQKSRELIAYAGLDWEDACLEFHKTDRPIRTASSLQVRRKMYQGSSEEWRRYEQFLGPMLEVLR